MIKEPFNILVIICVTTHIIRTIYEILKYREILVPNKISFIIMFLNMLILWISWVLLCRNDIWKIDLPLFVKYIGIMLSACGVIIFLTALFTIKTLESYEGDLITSGVYSFVRHPMYLGFLFWLIGFPLIFGGFYSMILSIIFICNILYWRYIEEDELSERFPAYHDYKKKTIF